MTLGTDESLNSIFDVAKPAEVIEPEIVETTSLATTVSTEMAVSANAEIELSKEEKDAQEDYEFTRTSLKELSKTSQEGLNDSLALAKSLDRPAGFDAVANMVKATVEVHRALQEVHKTAAEIRIASKTANPQAPVNVERGIVFTGTPEDLLRMLKPERT